MTVLEEERLRRGMQHELEMEQLARAALWLACYRAVGGAGGGEREELVETVADRLFATALAKGKRR